MKGTVMRQKKNKKPTSKDLQRAIMDLRYGLTAVQSQVGSLTEIFSDFLDYTHKKTKFIKYLEKKQESKVPGSVENPEVVQEELV